MASEKRLGSSILKEPSPLSSIIIHQQRHRSRDHKSQNGRVSRFLSLFLTVTYTLLCHLLSTGHSCITTVRPLFFPIVPPISISNSNNMNSYRYQKVFLILSVRNTPNPASILPLPARFLLLHTIHASNLTVSPDPFLLYPQAKKTGRSNRPNSNSSSDSTHHHQYQHEIQFDRRLITLSCQDINNTNLTLTR